ncbi:hypothetical protein AFM11_16200 [Mycolicibacterium wolinskyi]|uniref:Secreted protein n=1 Tax=Mycolicibacterium wolinskyi TaxID=59750 RepID=A0A132PLX0_9MYCO|nr:hypothetical protein [Mycolicibacterium wolinskyi]KWX23348.1 hypothetical protein AFM11_16200 [Mycolicibacterium wolinskyi]
MKRILGVLAVSAASAALTAPAVANAAVNTAVTSIPTPNGILEMHATADCAGDRCRFNTQANLLGPNGPIGLPGDTWARQTITLRSTDRSVWQEASYSAPSGSPRELHKGANNNNVLSRMLKATNNVEISVTYFGGGGLERFRVDGDSQPIDWRTGQPDREADFIACTQIQVVSSGWNLTTPTACAQTNFG